jgi:hypothetical protein
MSMPIRVGGERVLAIQRSYQVSYATGATPGENGYRLFFRLNAVNAFTDFTDLFQQYKIKRATIKWYTSNSLASETIGSIPTIIGQIHVATDRTNTETPTTLAAIGNLSEYKNQSFNVNQPDFSYTFRKLITYNGPPSSTSTTTLSSTNWAATNNPGTNWFGGHLILNSRTNGANSVNATITLDIHFRGIE